MSLTSRIACSAHTAMRLRQRRAHKCGRTHTRAAARFKTLPDSIDLLLRVHTVTIHTHETLFVCIERLCCECLRRSVHTRHGSHNTQRHSHLCLFTDVAMTVRRPPPTAAPPPARPCRAHAPLHSPSVAVWRSGSLDRT